MLGHTRLRHGVNCLKDFVPSCEDRADNISLTTRRVLVIFYFLTPWTVDALKTVQIM